MDNVLLELTPQVLVLVFTVGTVEILKTYLHIPQTLLWIPVIALAIGFNYLVGVLGMDALPLYDAVKLGVISSGLYGLTKPTVLAILEAIRDSQ
jgi:hypothetical protein